MAITLFIKDPRQKGSCQLFYRDIGDYLSREEKLQIVRESESIQNDKIAWKRISPNSDGDWINKRNQEFEKFPPIGDKGGVGKEVLFSIYSSGVKTNRDAWVFNFGHQECSEHVHRMIDFYNQEVERYLAACNKSSNQYPDVADFVNSDPRKISWTVNLKEDLGKGTLLNFDSASFGISLYRPFSKQWLYFNRRLNERVLRIPRLFPTFSCPNIVISLTGIGATKPFSTLIANVIPDYEMISKGQCFPLYYYEKEDHSGKTPIGKRIESISRRSGFSGANEYVRHDAITNWALDSFKKQYLDESIGKEDIFYYVYGLLHSQEYRARYENDLRKMLPRIPFAPNFWGFSKAGRELAHWHLNYETVDPWSLEEKKDENMISRMPPEEFYRVEEMKFGKNGKDKDKTTIVYNSRITLSGIPLDAYEYVVNGKPADSVSQSCAKRVHG